MTEIMNTPDNIPQGLLGRADEGSERQHSAGGQAADFVLLSGARGA